MHAQFSADPSRSSPYAPSSRLWLDVRHADGEDLLPGLPPFGAELAADWARLEALPMVEWPAVAAARLARLRQIHRAFREAPPGEAHAAFARFLAEGGTSLTRHARFEALHAAQLAAGPARWHWRDWPAALRDPESPEVAAFAEAQAEEVAFHAFAQFLADRGLSAAQRAAREGGARIGLIADLAIGVDGGGADAWARQTEFLSGVEIGAPPDIFNAKGQSWGITTYSPHGLTANGFAAFREMLGAAFRNAGGVRLDHVLGLRRLWLVPQGEGPAAGCYLRYPLEDMLRLVALESHRHKAIAIGEDLGTVPEGFRPKLQNAGLAGMRVMWFEQSGKSFKDPARWTREAVSMTSTHDLPTVAGWWEGRDLLWRETLGTTLEGRPRRVRRNGRSCGRPFARPAWPRGRCPARRRGRGWPMPPPPISAAPAAPWPCCRWRTPWRRWSSRTCPAPLTSTPTGAAGCTHRWSACSTTPRSNSACGASPGRGEPHERPRAAPPGRHHPPPRHLPHPVPRRLHAG
ncbi:4-alpha-glucanotransferase [Teichococcus aestuarii]|uniref:4-alpha-glucanotransferase n=1 Tax=Teichococcus aestuarii TaxID=568898 RepID=UPI0036156242